MKSTGEGIVRKWQRLLLFSLVAFLCAVPALMIATGIVNGPREGLDTQELFAVLVADSFSDDHSYSMIRGVLLYSILEWTAVLLAAATALLALAHFFVKQDSGAVVIAITAFWVALITTFHLMAFHGFYIEVINPEQFVHFNWVTARTFAGLLVLGTAAVVLWDGQRRSQLSLRHLVAITICSAVAAYTVIFLSAKAAFLPDLVRPGALIHRPLELIPLTLFGIGALVVFPRLHRLCQSPFSLALWVASIPLCASQIYMAVQTQGLFDPGFTAAQLNRVMAYGLILGGLAWDYGRVCRREILLERNLRASDRRVRMLVDNAVEAIVIFDRHHKIVGWNKQAENLFGYAASQVCDRDVVETLFGGRGAQIREDRQRFLSLLADMESCRGDDEESDPDDRHKVYEATVYNRQGKAHQIEYSMVPSLEELDPIFAVLIRDISERKALHLRMLQVDRLVAVGTLAAGVVHEIKNPLTYVMNNIYLAQEAAAYLGEAVDDKSDTQVLVDEINTSLSAANGGISRVRHIVDDMRVFAHSDPGARRPIATERAIELALRMTRGEVRRVARIETDMDETAPVFAEPTRLSQVFVNLMTNAAHAMAQIDADDHVLTIEVKERDDWVVARFCDTGPGFDEQVQERIFEPFFTTKSADEGTGLGLSLSKAIVEGFDGHIDVDSPPGQGAIFEVWLPIYREVEQSHS